MKQASLKILLVCTLCIGYIKAATAQELTFQYDAAGNQTVRQFVCVNCSIFPVSLASTEAGTQTSIIPDANKNFASTDRKLIAYPNPLTEVLNVKWTAINLVYLKTLEVFTTSGNRFFQQNYPNVELPPNISISFQKQAPGLYILRATYSDGKQENIKVIKK